jgi:hypothetical protein
VRAAGQQDSRGRPRRRSSLPPADWFTPAQRASIQRRVVLPQPQAVEVQWPVAPLATRGRKTGTPFVAVLLELLDASALLGAAGGAAAAIVTEQLAFCALPLTLPLVALLAGRAARGVRDARAQQELVELQSQVQALSEEARPPPPGRQHTLLTAQVRGKRGAPGCGGVTLV